MRYSWIVDWDQRPSILGRNCQVHRPLVRGCLGESTITIVFEGTLFERPTYSGKGDVIRWNAVLLGCSGSRRWSWCSGPCTTPRWGRLQAECCTDRRSSWRWTLTGNERRRIININDTRFVYSTNYSEQNQNESFDNFFLLSRVYKAGFVITNPYESLFFTNPLNQGFPTWGTRPPRAVFPNQYSRDQKCSQNNYQVLPKYTNISWIWCKLLPRTN